MLTDLQKLAAASVNVKHSLSRGEDVPAVALAVATKVRSAEPSEAVMPA